MVDFSILPIPHRSFLENVPWLEAARQLSSLKAQQQQNEANRIRMQYMQPELESQLAMEQAKQRYLPQSLAQALATGALRQKLMERQLAAQPQEPVGNYQIVNTPSGVFRINKRTGESEPIQYQGRNVMPLQRGGVSISQTPGGQWRIDYGQPATYSPQDGMQQQPSQQDSTTALAPNGGQTGEPSGIVPAIGSAGTKYSPAGQAYVDPRTGGSTLSLPRTTQGQFANRLVAEQLLEPQLMDYFNTVSKVVPQKTGLAAQLHWIGQDIAHEAGQSTPEYQAYKASQKGQLTNILEKQLKTYGINSTNENINSLRNALTPSSTESKQEFLRNAANQIADLMFTKGKLDKIFVGGLPLSGNEEKDAKIRQSAYNSLRQRIYNSLLQQTSEAGLRSLGFREER